MPNYCYNLLTVDGPQPEVERFVRENAGLYDGVWRALSFNQLIPYQGELQSYENRDEPVLVDTAWAEENWGVPYLEEAYSWREVPESGTAQRILFITPWAPPEKWLAAALAAYPLLDFDLLYLDEGQQFFGRFSRNRDGIEEFDYTYLIEKVESTAIRFYRERRSDFIARSIAEFEKNPELSVLIEVLQEPQMAEVLLGELAEEMILQYWELTQIIPEKNMSKFYNIADYGGKMGYTVNYGRIGTTGKIDHYRGAPSYEARILLAKKQEQGYVLIRDSAQLDLSAGLDNDWNTLQMKEVSPDYPGTRWGGHPFLEERAKYPHSQLSGAPLEFVAQVLLPDGRLAKFYSDPEWVGNGDFGDYEDSFAETRAENPHWQSILPEDLEAMYDNVLIEGAPAPKHLDMIEVSREELGSSKAYTADRFPTKPMWLLAPEIPADAFQFIMQVPYRSNLVEGKPDWDFAAAYLFWNGHNHARVLWQIDVPEMSSISNSGGLQMQKKTFWQKLHDVLFMPLGRAK